ncbi:hypothetical protein OS493_030745 [Desmophyllum pertusum]|uniref:Gamma-secretase-activating protein C-terminal domain-containing protein n=1 Tax=Desmophyllum pertusum TaxID=174260 RepID=A0A9W9Z8I3_9CNID|nr:hypothetical protein OS493_030745 [Desmophyllum pertusum]
MVELQKTFSFDEDILPHLLRKEKNAEAIKKRLQVRIVGQERDHAIILSWNDSGPSGTAGHKVTYFGLYEPSQHHLKLLFIHDKKVVVAGASVNQERTLLAFTVTERYYGLVDDPSCSDIPAIYKSFLAEIRPQNRIFSLKIERYTFQRVQFLYGEYLGYGSASKKESHMLFLHHKEAIGLYHIPMARFGDKGMIMSGQPRTQQVTDEFIWAQWDSQNQRLYLVYPKYQSVSSELDDEQDVKPDLMFAAYQFNERSTHVKVLKFPLPFPDVDLFAKTSHPEYLDLALAQTVSERHVNIQVVTLPGKGSFYICLQHPIAGDTKESKRTSGESAEPSSQLEYSIYALHHDDYLMVFLPGHFLHLLNCSTEREPCHHIILQGDAVPKFSSDDCVPNEPRMLLYLNKELSTTLQTGPYMFDSISGNAFKYSFDKAALADLFGRTHMPSTRLAILHLAVIHLRDLNLIKKIFEHLSHDPASPECLDLLQEYLVGATYGTFRRELEREAITLIPFTCVDTYRGHLEKDINRKRIAQISCSFVRDIPIEFQNVKNKMKQGDFWTALLQNTKRLPPRFKLKAPNADFFEQECDSEEETIDRLASHLQNHLPREAKLKIQNIAIEYVKCQARQSEQLLRLFNQALEFTDNPFTLPLCLRGAMREVVFFQLVERYCTAVTDLSFPLPTGFRTSMTCLGFRCLDRRMFLQYVDNGVLHLKKGFISRLVEEFDGEREEEDFVFQIICRLKHASAKDALLHWEHPFKARYLSQRLVEELLIKDNTGGLRENLEYSYCGARDGIPGGSSLSDAESPPDADLDAFRPLATLMTALRNSAAGDGSRQTVSQADLDYIEERALLETQRETVGSLGTIPF